jgi:hypothetical protein
MGRARERAQVAPRVVFCGAEPSNCMASGPGTGFAGKRICLFCQGTA